MKDIRISEVLALLNQGKDRKEIAKVFDISAIDCKKLFQHPALKGKRVRKQPDFNIIDDVSNVEIVQQRVDQELAESIDEGEVQNEELQPESEWNN